MAAVVTSFASYIANRGARASGFDRSAAEVARLRLDADTENTVRYVFTDWETAAGVRSNHGAQVERVAAGIFREAVHQETSYQKRSRENKSVVSPITGDVFPNGLPRSERGWRTETARPSSVNGGGFPMRTIMIPGDRDDPSPARCTVGAPEEWAMLPPVLPGHRGPVRRERVVKVWRALRSLERRSSMGPRLLVTLHLAYGQRDPNADYQNFGEVAPLIHITDAADDIANKATRSLRRERAETRCPEDDDIARARWIADRCARDLVVVEPRDAVRAMLERLKGAERRIAIADLAADARKLLTRASNALLRELREGSG